MSRKEGRLKEEMKATQIFNDEGFLNFSMGRLASSYEYGQADRCEGSVFEALAPGETVEFSDGQFILDDELLLAYRFQGYALDSGEEMWQCLSSGEIKSSWELT